jgi:hypothetical protein
MQDVQQHLLQAARCARQLQRLAGSHVPSITIEDYENGIEPDAASGALDGVMNVAVSYATMLLDSDAFCDLAGMSAAAAAQLQQGLAAGSCGGVVLHRKWEGVTTGEYMYPPKRDEWW